MISLCAGLSVLYTASHLWHIRPWRILTSNFCCIQLNLMHNKWWIPFVEHSFRIMKAFVPTKLLNRHAWQPHEHDWGQDHCVNCWQCNWCCGSMKIRVVTTTATTTTAQVASAKCQSMLASDQQIDWAPVRCNQNTSTNVNSNSDLPLPASIRDYSGTHSDWPLR